MTCVSAAAAPRASPARQPVPEVDPVLELRRLLVVVEQLRRQRVSGHATLGLLRAAAVSSAAGRLAGAAGYFLGVTALHTFHEQTAWT